MLTITFLTDGSSDRSLTPIVEWALREAGVLADLDLQWADLRHLRDRPASLVERLNTAVDLYPCELIVVHRDSEGDPPERRIDEISQAIDRSLVNVPHVPLVTVRMQEAWLLIDEHAIRIAAGNPNGCASLNLPDLGQLEDLPDPKAVLFEAFRNASELSGRRRRQLNVHACRLLVNQFVNDFSKLRALQAFSLFENSVRAIATKHFLAARRD